MRKRSTRYQAAVIRDEHILLVRVALTDWREFWLLPGGGREPGDATAEACVRREVREETGLEVTVGPMISDVTAHPDDERYERWRTYLCAVHAGEAQAGATDGIATLSAVAWLPIRDEQGWPAAVRDDRFLYPQLARIVRLLTEQDGEAMPMSSGKDE